jgi:hypothetical protein
MMAELASGKTDKVNYHEQVKLSCQRMTMRL